MSDPIREVVRGLATSWRESYLLRTDPAWWYFDPTSVRPTYRQGWKLHVSAVPVNAPETLRRVAEVLMPRRIGWKVASSLDQLGRLCAPPSPVSQAGKFITVYAEDDVAGLAEALHDVTKNFDAPVVPSDRRYRRGSNVYLRYGAFAAMTSYPEPDQSVKWLIVDDAGRRVEDRRAPGEHAPSWITAWPGPIERPAATRGPGLLGRGLTVRSVLNQSVKGGVYRCRWNDRDVVLKEARLGACADLLGRDARDLLANEWRILRALAGTGLAPEPLDFFFAEDNAYLVQEYRPGRTLRDLVEDLNYVGRPGPDTLRSLWDNVSSLIAAVRSHGVRLHDLTANNIIVHGDQFVIIDLEHAAPAGSPEPRFEARTPGYSWPGDERAGDDERTRYALAAIGHLIFTGIPPFLTFDDDFAPYADEVLREFGPEPDGPAAAAVELVRAELSMGRSARTPSKDSVLDDAVAAGLELVRRVEWDRRPWPWPERWSTGSVHPASFMSGTTGIAQYYLDLWQATGDREWLRRADELLEWTADVFPFVPGLTPAGLYFGVGSMPWLMTEVAASSDGRRARRWQARADELAGALERADLTTWDVTHGWAGLGLMELALLRATGDPARRAAVQDIVGRLSAGATVVAGVPTWPRGDTVFWGYGHGSAGIGYFLLHAAAALDDPDVRRQAVAIGHQLIEVATPTVGGRGLSWRHGPRSPKAPWTHWCNGASGVGQFLTALSSETGDPTFLDAAIRAGRAIAGSRAFGSCCRCHGLAGEGDYLLEVAGALDDGEEFRAAADRIGRKLDALTIPRDFAPKWPHEGDGSPRPGYMRGYTGIHAFRLRLAGLLTRTPLTLSASGRR
jgi:tRNA A-37 threonylcarbamoyl transferase component Bud32